MERAPARCGSGGGGAGDQAPQRLQGAARGGGGGLARPGGRGGGRRRRDDVQPLVAAGVAIPAGLLLGGRAGGDGADVPAVPVVGRLHGGVPLAEGRRLPAQRLVERQLLDERAEHPEADQGHASQDQGLLGQADALVDDAVAGGSSAETHGGTYM